MDPTAGPDPAPNPFADATLALRLRPPALPVHALERAALRQALARSREARLVLFCAPAGFGKTTAMRHHHEDVGRLQPAAARLWITLDEADNDLQRFLAKLQRAWQGLGGDAAHAPPAASAPPDLLHRLARAARPVTLFLDDLESLRNPVALELVRELLDHLPEGARMLIGTREQPRLNLSPLRTAGRLLELGPDRLRLSLEETQALLRRHARPLDRRTVVQLHERTEGWITALQLAALALQEHASPPAFVAAFSGSHGAVADYLLECVLAALPPRLRDFALLLGLLDEFDAGMAAAVTGLDDAPALLAELRRRNLFLTPLDEAQTRFRFHALFASFLRAQAGRRLPARVEAVHRAASDWRLSQGRVVPAIQHALAGDPPRALDLLQAHAEGLLLQGRFRLLCRWFDALGPAALVGRPTLVMIHACALALTRRQPEALRLLDALEAEASSPTGGGAPVDGDWLGAVRGLAHAMLDDSAACLEVCLRHHRPDAAASPGAPHGMLVNALASALSCATRFDEAMRVLVKAKQWHWRTGSDFNMAVAECVHANLEMVQGRLDDACTRLQTLADSRAGSGLAAIGGGTALGVGLAAALYAQDRLPEARRLLLECLPHVKDVGPPDSLITHHLLLVRCAAAAGERQEALQRLADLERQGHGFGLPRLVACAALERARLALADGAFDLAEDHLGQAAALDEVWARLRHFPANANDVEDLALGRLRLQVRRGAGRAAMEPLRRAIREAEAARRRVRAALLRLLWAEALWADGQTRLALRQLSDVVEWTRRTGHRRLLPDEGRALQPLLQALQAGGGEPVADGAAAPALSAEAAAGPTAEPSTGGSNGPGRSTASPPAQGLSERECEVLRMLSEGHSNRVIGERLFISENTVKAHLRSLNTKLQASNRTQAVAHARRLGWLGGG